MIEHTITSSRTQWGWITTCTCKRFVASVPTMAVGTRMGEEHIAEALLNQPTGDTK